MRRQKRTVVVPAFCQVLRDAGWLLKIAPEPMMVSLGFDEYIYVKREDRLLHLHICAGTVDWNANRYVREPFGDYTVAYEPKGKGIGLASLQLFLEAK